VHGSSTATLSALVIQSIWRHFRCPRPALRARDPLVSAAKLAVQFSACSRAAVAACSLTRAYACPLLAVLPLIAVPGLAACGSGAAAEVGESKASTAKPSTSLGMHTRDYDYVPPRVGPEYQCFVPDTGSIAPLGQSTSAVGASAGPSAAARWRQLAPVCLHSRAVAVSGAHDVLLDEVSGYACVRVGTAPCCGASCAQACCGKREPTWLKSVSAHTPRGRPTVRAALHTRA
jgi:hypothetical protein